DDRQTSVLEIIYNDVSSQTSATQNERMQHSFKPVSIGGLQLTFQPDKPQSFTLSLPPYNSTNQKIIWPRGNGLLFRADDPFWQKEIFESEWDAGESFSIPAWGTIADGRTISMFTSMPYRTSIS